MHPTHSETARRDLTKIAEYFEQVVVGHMPRKEHENVARCVRAIRASIDTIEKQELQMTVYGQTIKALLDLIALQQAQLGGDQTQIAALQTQLTEQAGNATDADDAAQLAAAQAVLAANQPPAATPIAPDPTATTVAGSDAAASPAPAADSTVVIPDAPAAPVTQ